MWIASTEGLYRIYPDKILEKDSIPPKVWITSMRINGDPYEAADGDVFQEAVSYTQSIRLPYWKNDLSFEFVALHYLDPDKNQYSWKMEGLDQEWTTPSTDRKVRYTGLNPGTYSFQVKGSNADGVWNEEGASIKVIIRPPWWQTWTARVAYLLAITGGIVLFFRWRTNRLRRENELLEQKVQSRTEKLNRSYEDLKATQDQLIHSEKMASLGELTAGIAHEIKNPLNFVNNFSEVTGELVDEMKEEIKKGDLDEVESISDDIKQNLEKITHHGKRADSIVQNMLQHSRTGTGEKVPTDLNALCQEYLNLAYHGYRAKDHNFNAEIISTLAADLPKVLIVPQDIGRVLLNLINNALYAASSKAKSSEDPNFKPKITLHTKNLGDQVEIKVTDNGSGIPEKIKEKIFQPFFTTKPTGQGTGLGLSLSYDIIKAHGGELSVESIEGESTTFKLLLPESD